MGSKNLTMKNITILGAGITGLWQALTLTRAGHKVTLVEKSQDGFANASSWFSGAMLAPYCESEPTEPIIQKLGIRSLNIWRDTFPNLKTNGTLVLAQSRDQSVLKQFARDTEGHSWIDELQIAEKEPDLAERFTSALFYPDEAHVSPRQTMPQLLEMFKAAGGEFRRNQLTDADTDDIIVDCTGMAAQSALPDLRGVRGEMAIIRSTEINLNRPVRLLHPRFPLYIVPWEDHKYMLGATVIERADNGPVTLRSALDLLSTAYALHPAFGEAEILEFGTAIRPAFPDNTPKIVLRDRHIYINGTYRHGFLLAPVLAALTSQYINTGERTSELMIED